MSGVGGQFPGFPKWYSKYRKELIERGRDIAATPYVPYQGPRNAPFTKLQRRSRKIAKAAVPNQALYNLGEQSLGRGLTTNVTQDVQPYLNAGIAPTYTDVENYMNPYQKNVVNRIAKLGQRNLKENLQAIGSNFIRAGQSGSSRQQKFANKALRQTNESVLARQQEALQHGYTQALAASEAAKGRQLGAGRIAAEAGERQAGRQVSGSRLAPEIAGQQQLGQLRYGETLGGIGHQEQTQEQEIMDQRYRDFLEQQRHPSQQLQEIGGLLHGFQPTPSTIQRTANPVPPRASSTSQFAGLAAGLFGSAGGFAEGGSVTSSLLSRGVDEAKMAASRQNMQNYAEELQQSPETSRQQGLWDLLARTGFGMGASQQRDPYARFSEGAARGFEGLTQARANAAEQRMKGFNLQNALEQQELDPLQKLEELRIKNEQQRELQELKGQQGLELAGHKFGLEKELPKNKIIKTANGNFTYEENPETGEMEAIPVRGIPNVQEQKVEQEAAKSSLKSNRKLYDETIEAGKSAEEQLDSVKRLEQLLNKPGVRRSDLRQSIIKMGERVGIHISPNANEQEIDAISKEILARNFANLRGGGRGNQVEFEQALRATPGIYTHPESAKRILAQYNKAAKKSLMLKKRAQSLNQQYQGNFPATFDIMLEQPSPEEVDNEISSLENKLANYEGQALEGE
jgi:hypothetical protein